MEGFKLLFFLLNNPPSLVTQRGEVIIGPPLHLQQNGPKFYLKKKSMNKQRIRWMISQKISLRKRT